MEVVDHKSGGVAVSPRVAELFKGVHTGGDLLSMVAKGNGYASTRADGQRWALVGSIHSSKDEWVSFRAVFNTSVPSDIKSSKPVSLHVLERKSSVVVDSKKELIGDIGEKITAVFDRKGDAPKSDVGGSVDSGVASATKDFVHKVLNRGGSPLSIQSGKAPFNASDVADHEGMRGLIESISKAEDIEIKQMERIAVSPVISTHARSVLQGWLKAKDVSLDGVAVEMTKSLSTACMDASKSYKFSVADGVVSRTAGGSLVFADKDVEIVEAGGVVIQVDKSSESKIRVACTATQLDLKIANSDKGSPASTDTPINPYASLDFDTGVRKEDGRAMFSTDVLYPVFFTTNIASANSSGESRGIKLVCFTPNATRASKGEVVKLLTASECSLNDQTDVVGRLKSNLHEMLKTAPVALLMAAKLADTAKNAQSEGSYGGSHPGKFTVKRDTLGSTKDLPTKETVHKNAVSAYASLWGENQDRLMLRALRYMLMNGK
jgi:hypothetical protein